MLLPQLSAHLCLALCSIPPVQLAKFVSGGGPHAAIASHLVQSSPAFAVLVAMMKEGCNAGGWAQCEPARRSETTGTVRPVLLACHTPPFRVPPSTAPRCLLIIARRPRATGRFNAQSCANAFWAVCKMHTTEHPASPDLLTALEAALALALTSTCDAQRPNSQAVSSTW